MGRSSNYFILTVFFILVIQPVLSQSVSIHFEKNSPQQQYAASALEKALLNKKYVLKELPAGDQIKLVIDSTIVAPESFTIKPAGKTITITGGDERGLIYGCLSLAEDIRNGISLSNYRSKNEKPFLPFRAIKYDLPWDSYRHSYALELHDQTCRDTSYWRSFLDMMQKTVSMHLRSGIFILYFPHQAKEFSRSKSME
jgi:hypothetical protein